MYHIQGRMMTGYTIALIGNTNSGKTSILFHWLGLESKPKPTRMTHCYTLQQPNNNNLALWEIGSQFNEQGYYDLWLKNCDIILCCLPATLSEIEFANEIRHWASVIDHQNSAKVKLLVMTQCDLLTDLSGLNTFRQMAKQQGFYDLVPTSTITYQNLAFLRALSSHLLEPLNINPNYHTILQETEGTLLVKARRLLGYYAKRNNCLRLFFSGHSNRHHTQEVNDIVDQLKKNEITDAEELLNTLKRIRLVNRLGTLAKIIHALEKYLLFNSEYYLTLEEQQTSTQRGLPQKS